MALPDSHVLFDIVQTPQQTSLLLDELVEDCPPAE
jgi:hypothetical protein